MRINFESNDTKFNEFGNIDLLFRGIAGEEEGHYAVGIHWKASSKMTLVMLDHRWLFRFCWIIRQWVRGIYQVRQFHKPFPAKNSWAYNWACFKFDIQMFWQYTILHRKPEVESEEDLLQEKHKKE